MLIFSLFVCRSRVPCVRLFVVSRVTTAVHPFNDKRRAKRFLLPEKGFCVCQKPCLSAILAGRGLRIYAVVSVGKRGYVLI